MGIGWLTKRTVRRIEQEEAEVTESFRFLCDLLFKSLVPGRVTGSLPVSFHHALDSKARLPPVGNDFTSFCC